MNLRTKTLGLLAVMLAGLLLVQTVMTSRILFTGAQNLEEKLTRRTVQQLQSVLGIEMAELEVLVKDWGNWDDTYAFIEDRSAEYIESNLNAPAITTIKIHAFVILDNQGRVVWGSGCDLESATLVPYPDDLLAKLALPMGPAMSDQEVRLHGLLHLDEGTMLVSTGPILTSEEKGPRRGVIVFGRWLDDAMLARLKSFLHFPVTMTPWHDLMPPELAAVRDQLTVDEPSEVVVLDDERIAGYGLLSDLHGKPALLAQVITPREIHAESVRGRRMMLLWLVAAAVALGGAMHLLLEFSILRRLSGLMRGIGRIRSGSDLTQRIAVRGSDEIGRLGQALNDMLGSLEQSRVGEQFARIALAEEKERLAVTLRSIGDGVITTDTEGRVNLMNGVAEAMTGWTMAEAMNRPLSDVFTLVNEQSRQPVENPVTKVLETGSTVGMANQTALIGRDGRERLIADSAAPIRDHDGRIIGVVLVVRDVTEKTRIEVERQRANKLESVGVLAGGIAHDFNNVLTAILANVTMAQLYANPGDDLQLSLGEAEKACLRARDLTHQLLTFAKGGTPLKEVTLLGDVVTEAASLAARGSACRCQFTLANDLWPVEADRGQMHQVFNNLVLNAVQAMPSGGDIRLEAANILVSEENFLPLTAGRYVRVRIIDHGIGIPAEHLGKIFDPYFTTKQRGTGLGLTTCYSIVSKHGGYVAVSSKLGKGSTFTVYLPATSKSVVRAGTDSGQLIRGEGRVLIMDDEQPILDVGSSMLKKIGYEVVQARDGEEALNLYAAAREKGRPFDCVIMDITIPSGMGGREAMTKLLALDPDVRAIVSSGYSNDLVLQDFRSFGFAGVMVKPYTLTEMSKALAEALAGRRSAPFTADHPKQA
jgi:PAS domain S-box-containing protein